MYAFKFEAFPGFRFFPGVFWGNSKKNPNLKKLLIIFS